MYTPTLIFAESKRRKKADINKSVKFKKHLKQRERERESKFNFTEK